MLTVYLQLFALYRLFHFNLTVSRNILLELVFFLLRVVPHRFSFLTDSLSHAITFVFTVSLFLGSERAERIVVLDALAVHGTLRPDVVAGGALPAHDLAWAPPR